jgi:hypothetical protein
LEIAVCIVVTFCVAILVVVMSSIFNALCERIDRLQRRIDRSNKMLAFFFDVYPVDKGLLRTEEITISWLLAKDAAEETKKDACQFMSETMKELARQQEQAAQQQL